MFHVKHLFRKIFWSGNIPLQEKLTPEKKKPRRRFQEEKATSPGETSLPPTPTKGKAPDRMIGGSLFLY